MLPSFFRLAGFRPEGLRPLDEEDGMQLLAQSSEDEDTAVEGQARFACGRCGQGFTQKRSLTRHQQRTKRCADAGLDSRVESCECCDPPKPFARADTRRLHEFRKRRGTDQKGRQSKASSSTVPQSTGRPGSARLTGGRAPEICEAGELDIAHGLVFASGEDSGLTSRTPSPGEHDWGIELQPEKPYVGSASLHEHARIGYAPAADFSVFSASLAKPVLHQATADEFLVRDIGAMLDDIQPYDWERDPEGYLDIVDLGALFSTRMSSLDVSVHDQTIDWRDELHNPHEGSTTSVSDAASIRSSSSRRSVTGITGRFLASVLKSPPSVARGRNTMTKKAQECSICKKPYEKDTISLRAHLDRHVHEFRAEGTAPTCDICEVGFASQADLDWHLQSVKKSLPGQCCGLPPGHDQPCRGHPCGFNFKHDESCMGHHPPSSSISAWTENDRFRFCQLLWKWEISQVRKAVREGNTVDHLRSFKAFDNVSLPDFCRPSVHSKISNFSWCSEPIQHARDMHGLQDRLGRMDLDGLPVQLRRNARRLAGMQNEVDEELVDAAVFGNVNSALKLLGCGAAPGAALPVAVEKGDGEMIEMLLRAGAHVDLGLIFSAVSCGQATAAKQLLNNRGHNFTTSHGAILLQLAIRSADLDTLLALLSCRVEVDQKPTGDQLVEYERYANNPRESGRSTVHYPAYHVLTSDPPLCVAACLGHAWAIASLLDAGANPDAEGVKGTALGYAIRHQPDCVPILVSGKDHVRYERCWNGNDALELAISSSTSSALFIVRRLLNRCKAINGSGCEHGKTALKAYLKLSSAALFEVLVACEVDMNTTINKFGETALQFAARTRMDDAVLTDLLNSGADTCGTDKVGYTALDHAIRIRNTQATQLLLDAGAARSSSGFHALLNAGSSLDDAVEDAMIIEMLAACGLDVNALDTFGHTPLYHACQQGRIIAVDALLTAGASPTCRALHTAVLRGTPISQQCIQKLVDSGADLDELDEQNCPPIKLAAFHLRVEAFEQLINAGADLNGLNYYDLHELMCEQRGSRVAPLLRSLFAYGVSLLGSEDRDGESLLHRAAANGDVESIFVLGAADSHLSRGNLSCLMRDPARRDSADPYTSCSPRVTMSAVTLDVLYFELTAGKQRTADDLCIDGVQLKKTLDTQYAICKALLHFQPPGLDMDFSLPVIMAIIRHDTLKLNTGNDAAQATHTANHFVQLLLRKTSSKLTPELTAQLVAHTARCFLDKDHRITESLEINGALLEFLLRQYGDEDKSELNSLCDELLENLPMGPPGYNYTYSALFTRAALMRYMALAGLDIQFVPPREIGSLRTQRVLPRAEYSQN
ncbi:hypothetical protein LTR17_020254 [Elasticomyces elasticus]|nr:hypothetical protein LTR17_020254 [Elasticomyces elasticus]